MDRFDWNVEKNLMLEQERGITLEEIVFAIEVLIPLDVNP